jgi:transposase
MDDAAFRESRVRDGATVAQSAAMLSVSGATRVFLAVQPVDLRASFNRLHSLVIEVLREDPLSGHLFVFTNRRRNRVKALFWDGTGLWVCAKRLERNRFQWPRHESHSLRLRGEEFTALISGLEVRKRPGWYRR